MIFNKTISAIKESIQLFKFKNLLSKFPFTIEKINKNKGKVKVYFEAYDTEGNHIESYIYSPLDLHPKLNNYSYTVQNEDFIFISENVNKKLVYKNVFKIFYEELLLFFSVLKQTPLIKKRDSMNKTIETLEQMMSSLNVMVDEITGDPKCQTKFSTA